MLTVGTIIILMMLTYWFQPCLEKILTSGKSIYLFLISCGIEFDEICLKFRRNLRNFRDLCGNSAEIDEIVRETILIPRKFDLSKNSAGIFPNMGIFSKLAA